MDNSQNVRQRRKDTGGYSSSEFLPDWKSGDFSSIPPSSEHSGVNNNKEDMQISVDLTERTNYGIIADEDVPCKIIVIGDAGVGKTSFVKRYVSKVFTNTYRWTVGVDFALKVVKWTENVSVKLQLWDIAGQERFTCMTRVYYKDAHACIIMFDLSQRQTFLNAMKWKNDLDNKCTLPDGSPIPCILLANKCDLKHREVDQAEIESFCKDQDFIGWTEVSVKEGLMIEETMKFLLEEMMRRYNDNNLPRSSNLTHSSIKLSSEAKADKCKC